MASKLFQPAKTKGMFRRSGVLQGPRLIAAIVIVVFFLLYLGSTESDERVTDDDYTVGSNRLSTSALRPNGKQLEKEASEKHREAQSETLANKFYEYLGQHKTTPKNQNASGAAGKSPHRRPLSTASGISPEALSDPVCQALAKGIEDLLVVVKTPAAELYNQLPSRFLVDLRCAPLILFSYVKHKIGSHMVHDALSYVSEKTRKKHREFELYHRLQSASKGYQELSRFKEDRDHALHKWTVIPALLESYRLHPNKKWFVLIEGDTYLSLPNVMSWLGHLNPDEPFYAGAQSLIGTTELASSGAGIIVSRAAVAKLSQLYKSRQQDWEAQLAESCCGDQVLAEAFKEAGITLHRSWPNVQNESPLTIDWGSQHWCMAAVTWHRMTPTLMDMLYQFESRWIMDHEPKQEAIASEEVEIEADAGAGTEGQTNTARETNALPATETIPRVRNRLQTAVPRSRQWYKRDVGLSSSSPSSTSTLGYSALAPSASAISRPNRDFKAPLGIPPILYRNIYQGILQPLVSETSNRTDWDNLSTAHVLTDSTHGGSQAHSSFKTCRAACDIRSKCIQFAHEPNKCSLGIVPRIGEPTNPDRMMKSGWIAHRIKAFGAGLGKCDQVEPFFMPKPVDAHTNMQDDKEDESESDDVVLKSSRLLADGDMDSDADSTSKADKDEAADGNKSANAEGGQHET